MRRRTWHALARQQLEGVLKISPNYSDAADVTKAGRRSWSCSREPEAVKNWKNIATE